MQYCCLFLTSFLGKSFLVTYTTGKNFVTISQAGGGDNVGYKFSSDTEVFNLAILENRSSLKITTIQSPENKSKDINCILYKDFIF